MKSLKTHKTFNGVTQFWEHESKVTGTSMKFSTFKPEGEIKGCLIWLSGLTCNEENFITKAGAQKYLAEHQLMVICPDTSPRGLNLPQEHEAYDFGSGAGFYVNATTPGYKDHYRMYDYIKDELCDLIKSEFGVTRISITGHSMGGHGALILGLKETDKFVSVSAFSPIVNPVNCPWGVKAFTGYLGEDRSQWSKYDACELLKAGSRHPRSILIHQGTEDDFLKQKQLLTPNWQEVANQSGQKTSVVMADGYDHSYYFIATFIEEHIRFHAEALKAGK